MEILQKIAKNRQEKYVFRQIKNIATECHMFDLRAFKKLVDIYTKKGKDALKLNLNHIVERDRVMEAFYQSTRDKKVSVRQQVRLFKDLSGLSRASFFRIKQKVSKSHS